MRKKIAVTSLQVGMQVVDTGLSWIEHPYLYSTPGKIKGEEQLKTIIDEGYKEAFIEVSMGPRVDDVHSAGVEEELRRAMESTRQTDREPRSTIASIQEELAEAKIIHADSLKLVKDTFRDARMGAALDIDSASELVERVIDSVMRNTYALISLSKLRAFDEYTYNHSINVGVLSVGFARFIGLPREVIQPLGLAGLLHDMGKARIPDSILNKPGRLTEEEFAMIRRHSQLGVDLLRQTPELSTEILRGVGEHHEKYNGSGYPRGLKGDEISLFASLISLADVYDALTSERVYKRGIQPNKAMGTIFSMRGQDFFPRHVERFVSFLGIYPMGSLVLLSSGEYALVSSPNPGDPMRPNVKVIMDRKARTCLPRDVDLSQESDAGPGPLGEGLQIVNTLDPRDHRVDPSQYLL